MIFSSTTRWLLTAGGVVAGGGIVAWSTTLPEGREPYILAHAVGAAPFLAVSLACTWRALRVAPGEYRGFWTCWFAACACSATATVAAIGAVAWDSPLLLAVDIAMMVAASPFWTSASLRMVRALAGQRSVSVDVVDAATALVVLGAPALLVVAEPLSRADELAFAVPFAAAAVITPGVLYLSLVNLAYVSPRERAANGIGVALGVSFAVSITMQLARLLGELHLQRPTVLAAHVTTMGLLMALPLWSHRGLTGRLDGLPVEHQVRGRSPMPYVAIVLLPLVALYVLAARRDRPWTVTLLVVALLAVVLLGAIRHTVMAREARRLYGDLARMSEERRRLVASMVRALEEDRCRTATELHTQAVRLLTALGATIQTAYAALPTDAAVAIREAILQTHGELSDRAEQFRRLMLAMRPAVLAAPADGGRGGDHVLDAALTAYASELFVERRSCRLDVEVMPGLELDWTTSTVVYRIAREALLNTARHARASTVGVQVAGRDGGVVVEVSDDGVGFEPERVASGSGFALMELFTELGGGELSVSSSPGHGTCVRSVLRTGRVGDAGERPRCDPPREEPRRRHLTLVPPPQG